MHLEDLLSAHDGAMQDGWGTWHTDVAESLSGSAEVNVDHKESGFFWKLLSWAEIATSEAVRRQDISLARVALVALVLADSAGVLDRRDIRVVGGLLRRTADLLDLNVSHEVDAVRTSPVIAGADEGFWNGFQRLPRMKMLSMRRSVRAVNSRSSEDQPQSI